MAHLPVAGLYQPGSGFSFLATQIDTEHPVEAHEIQVTSRELKELGVITQSFEDIPQFIVQAYSAFLCVVNGWTLTWQVTASAALLQIEAHFPEVGGWWWKLLLTGPLLRSLVMGGLTAWGTWKSEFPVSEELCIALLVLNGVALAELLSFVDDTSNEELLGSGIPSIGDLMEVDRKLREDAEELQRCRAEKIGELQESLRRGGVEPAEVQRLIAAGYQSVDQLKELNDGDLMELGMVPRARAQFRKAMSRTTRKPSRRSSLPSTVSQVESSTAARSKRPNHCDVWGAFPFLTASSR